MSVHSYAVMDRSEAVNLARSLVESDHQLKPRGRQALAEAVLAMDEALRKIAACSSEPTRDEVIEECAQAAEHVTPRHTECGNRIAAAIRSLATPSYTGEKNG